MGDEKNLINLKEAASLSGYSADYIGQLIRSGKIDGKQVYCNVQWMTTADAVLEYKKNGGSKKSDKKTVKNKISSLKRKVGMELNIMRLFFQSFKTALPVLIFLIVVFLLLIFSIIFLVSDTNDLNKNKNINENEQLLTF